MRIQISIIIGFTLIMALVLAGATAAKGSTPHHPDLIDGKIGDREVDDGTLTKAREENLREFFLNGYEHFNQGRYLEASCDLYEYLHRLTPDSTDYEWAEFFFGISLKKLGFSHASVDTLVHLVTRRPNLKIITYSLELLEEISRSKPFDRDLLVLTALCDQSYDFTKGAVAEFVNYYQGEYDWEHGLFQWGDNHFKKLTKNSHYYHKSIFKKGLREISDGRIDVAMDLFKQILTAETASVELKDDTRKTLARLYYETGQYTEADFLYHQIEMNIVEQAQNLLERAWAHYRMGNPERSMGLLYSFEAPSYQNSFTPEFYILKSFIYKDVCHYEKAMHVLDSFKERYGPALEKIYQRGKAQDNDALLLVILNKRRVKRLWQFLTLLEKEQTQCETIADKKLVAYLTQLYSLKRAEYEKHFRLMVENEYEKIANGLLQFEEEAHLMEYEIGLDMYQRVSEFRYTNDKSPETLQNKKKRVAVYPFQGEFWNDELDNYTVTLPNKCKDAEEWDIFFK
ncbi:MAG: hypothetical protein JRH15_00190 [Deltaproteobacteria bacterium]|nr:hypothetical protein [Deltaproteobacteria bacterium]